MFMHFIMNKMRSKLLSDDILENFNMQDCNKYLFFIIYITPLCVTYYSNYSKN